MPLSSAQQAAADQASGKVARLHGGDVQVIKSGGKLAVQSGAEIDVESGGALKFNGTDAAGVLAAAVAGVAAGYKIARGEVTLDGSNPTSITTGLATVVAAAVSPKTASAPGLDPTHFTVDYGGAIPAGRLDVHAWKPTAANDCTLIASTNNAAVLSWIAVGT